MAGAMVHFGFVRAMDQFGNPFSNSCRAARIDWGCKSNPPPAVVTCCDSSQFRGETQFAYNADSRLKTLTAKNATPGDQLTKGGMAAARIKLGQIKWGQLLTLNI